MRDQLVQYVNLLFAGADGAEEIKQEILQNTLDRYDDLIAQGKSEQAAYQLSISGIGDVQEILSSRPAAPSYAPSKAQHPDDAAFDEQKEADSRKNKIVKAIAIGLLILSAIPVLILEDSIGVCACLAMVAVAVVVLIANGKETSEDTHEAVTSTEAKNRRSAINRGITGGIWAVGLCVYLLLSFHSGEWGTTWIIFPVLGCLCGLVDAIFDLNKTLVSAIVRIVIFCIVLSILGVATVGLNYAFHLEEGSFSDSAYTMGEGSVNAQQVKNIHVEWVSGSITVEPGDTDRITFTEAAYSEKAKPMVWEQKGDTLYIRFCEPTFNIGINIGTTVNVASKDLVITVPQDWVSQELNIDSVSANVFVSELVCDDIELTNVSGECEFINCNTKDLSLETVSGGIEYRGGLNNLDCNSVSADCVIYAMSHPTSIDMEGVSCDLTLYLPETCGFTVDTDSASGDFESDFATTNERGKYIYGDGQCRINAESVSGDIIIRKIK